MCPDYNSVEAILLLLLVVSIFALGLLVAIIWITDEIAINRRRNRTEYKAHPKAIQF